MSVQEKKCSVCKVAKDFSQFYRDQRTRDQLKSECKTCHKKQIKKGYQKQLATSATPNLSQTISPPNYEADIMIRHLYSVCQNLLSRISELEKQVILLIKR
jgi:hypothetical protein